MSTLIFDIKTTSTSLFAPRLARLTLKREGASDVVDIATPALITTTSRGIVPHLSRDNVTLTTPIGWTQVHFETFLERMPPVPTMLEGSRPLHTFLGFRPDKNLIALSLRDPYDGEEIPPNTKDHVSCRCVRGVRKVTPSEWRSYVLACKPDIVTALSDTVFTPRPHSQKRLMKSLERSTAWLADILRPLQSGEPTTRPHVLVCLAGGNEIRARKAFADSLVEPLYGKDLELVSPSKTLDAGVAGYVFDLVPLRLRPVAMKAEDEDHDITTLLRTSLEPLPLTKPRIAHSCRSPHEILRLIQDVGMDLFDAHFAQRAADIGVALDYTFPAQAREGKSGGLAPRIRECGRTDLGHNLFNVSYAHDHSRLAASFVGAASSVEASDPHLPVCFCGACSPRSFPSWIGHSEVDTAHIHLDTFQQPFTRAYIHHLLHTHEMSSHTLLVMHNLTVMDAFFAGVREVIHRPDGAAVFREEVARFCSTYDEDMVIFEEATTEWAAVERTRGKGRLHREKSSDNSQDV